MRLLTTFAAAAALLLAACAPDRAAAPVAAPAEARPALWKLADEDTTIYLFGTIHVLPKGYAWRSARFDQAVRDADALVIETVIDRDPQAASKLLLGLGMKPGLPPIGERVPADKKAALAAMIGRSGLPPSLFDGLKTWTAAVMLVAVTLKDMALGDGVGLEQQLEADFRARGRPIEGLETPEQQLGFFDTLPEAAQREFLASLVDDPEGLRKDYDAMLAAWSRGDEKAISDSFDEELKSSPELREVLLRRRNAVWAEALKARLATPGTLLVAVGAGHLVGSDSVAAMLGKAGLKTVRVQ